MCKPLERDEVTSSSGRSEGTVSRQISEVRYRLNELYTVFHVMVLRICVSLCRDAGAEIGECDVPSQPMLEWLCLKLLGASSLLARTLERCTQAFMYPKCSHSQPYTLVRKFL